MDIQLIGALDYKKVDKVLESKIENKEDRDEIIEKLKKIEVARRSEIVAASGRLSRFAGDVLEILGISEEKTLQQNSKFASRVCGMGHNSISDHDYYVLALKNVSPVIEQTIIAERFSSFTIKSRREVDFSNAGFYVPDFHDKEGNVVENNAEIKEKFEKHTKYLFNMYQAFLEMGVSKEDARFVLPYNYNSNIIMGVDAHTLKDMIIKFTKTKYANIGEIRELGEKLYAIAKKNCPYIIEEIDKIPVQNKDAVDEYLQDNLKETTYEVRGKTKILNATNDNDDDILVSALMRRRNLTFEEAWDVYEQAVINNPNFKKELMRKIVFEGDKDELAQVNFQLQIPISFAVLTHLTRHRTHNILIPDFVPVVDLKQYKIPPAIAKNPSLKAKFEEIFATNAMFYEELKNLGIRDEDLVYCTLSGNMVNVVTNMDGKTLEHILALRECNKAQWEIRQVANDIHKEVAKANNSSILASLLGPTCVTRGICKEGKESCGRLEAIKKGEEKGFQYIKK